MKKFTVLITALLLLTMAVAAHATGSATLVDSKPTTTSYGTVCYKFNFDSDSNEALGHYHKSSGALKTPWVAVPFGIPFAVFVETVDADSAASAYYPWGPDTIGLALETTAPTGIAIDSAAAPYKFNKAHIIWDLRSINWTEFTSQHYFEPVWNDTLNDTVGIGATSLKSGTANKATTPMVNLGQLRFSLCVDAADSVLDGKVRLNVYIVFKTPVLENRYWNYWPGDDNSTYSVLDRPASFWHEVPWALKPSRRLACPVVLGT